MPRNYTNQELSRDLFHVLTLHRALNGVLDEGFMDRCISIRSEIEAASFNAADHYLTQRSLRGTSLGYLDARTRSTMLSLIVHGKDYVEREMIADFEKRFAAKEMELSAYPILPWEAVYIDGIEPNLPGVPIARSYRAWLRKNEEEEEDPWFHLMRFEPKDPTQETIHLNPRAMSHKHRGT